MNLDIVPFDCFEKSYSSCGEWRHVNFVPRPRPRQWNVFLIIDEYFETPIKMVRLDLDNYLLTFFDRNDGKYIFNPGETYRLRFERIENCGELELRADELPKEEDAA